MEEPMNVMLYDINNIYSMCWEEGEGYYIQKATPIPPHFATSAFFKTQKEAIEALTKGIVKFYAPPGEITEVMGYLVREPYFLN